MGPDVEADPVVVDMDVGVVSLFLGELGRTVHELHRLDKILEAKLFRDPLAAEGPTRDLREESV